MSESSMTKNFGDHLKNERELRGISLEEISHATKIHQRFLKALEDNQFDELPGEVFIKGYIRSYAQSIGSNESEILAVYDEACGRFRSEEIEKQKSEKIFRARQKTKQKKTAVGIAGLAIIMGGIYLFTQLGQKSTPSTAANNTEMPTAAPTATEIAPPAPEQEERSFIKETQFVTPTEASSPTVEMSDSTPPPKTAPQEISTPPAPQPTETAHPAFPTPGSEDTSGESSPSSKPEPATGLPVTEPEQARNPAVPSQEFAPTSFPEKNLEETKKDDIIGETNINQLVTDNEVGELKNRKVIVNSDTLTVNNKPLELQIRVEEPTWFNLLIDGIEEKDFILQPGETEKVSGNKYFTVTIGNKQGTELALNGHALTLPESGENNVIRNFLISEELVTNN